MPSGPGGSSVSDPLPSWLIGVACTNDSVPTPIVQMAPPARPRKRSAARVGNSRDGTSGIDAVVFPKNADGAPLFYYRLRDPRPNAPAGSLWHFQTPFYDGKFEDTFVFYEHGTPGAP